MEDLLYWSEETEETYNSFLDDELDSYIDTNIQKYEGILDNNSNTELPLMEICFTAGNEKYYKYFFLSTPFYEETFNNLNMGNILNIDITNNEIKLYEYPTGKLIKGAAVNLKISKIAMELNTINKMFPINQIKQNDPEIDELLEIWLQQE